MNDDQPWDDEEELGPLVRPYTVTRGRTRIGRPDLQVITLVVAAQPENQVPGAGLDFEHLQILRWCQRPLSIAELSSHLQLPLSVVKILVADLIMRDLLIFRAAVTPDIRVLQAVINGIRQL
ncbi:MAG: hypothetical protein QG622_3238 [Actinomycetota bacterium]|nr:hypothetical protein [Actinomycetota bacterium]